MSSTQSISFISNYDEEKTSNSGADNNKMSESDELERDETMQDLFIEEAIGFNNGTDFVETADTIQTSDFDEKTRLKSYCKELFEKCCHNNNTNLNSEYEEEELAEASKNAYVLCTDIIAYFKEQHIMESNDSTEIDMLHGLFCDHFNVPDDGWQNSGDQLRECKLDYETMSRIIQDWIRKVTLNQSIRNNNETGQCNINVSKEDLESFQSFDNEDFKLYDDRIRVNARLRSSNIYRPHLRFDTFDDEFGSSVASSSKPSVSPSIDENVFDSDADFLLQPNHEYYEKRLSSMHSKNCELESEIAQLKQNLDDLRMQSRNAEDYNSQLATEVERQQEYTNEWKLRYQDLASKHGGALEENEQLQKMIISLKSEVRTVMMENEHVKESLKYYQNELKCAEYEVAQCNERTGDYNKVYDELQEEKKSNLESKERIWRLEDSFKEVKSQLSEKIQQNGHLTKEIYESNSTVESLKENISNLEDRLAKTNQKLFRKNIYSSNKCLNRQSTTRKELAGSTGNLMITSDTNEDETVSNACLLSEFNENTFHVSMNDKDFRYEQFEQAVETNHSSEEEAMLEYFKGFFILTDELKVKYKVLEKSKKNDTNNNKYNKSVQLNESFTKVMETFIDYNQRNNFNKKQEMLENLVSQNKLLTQTNNYLTEKLSLVDSKLKCSKNQLLAVIMFIFKFISLKLSFYPFDAIYNSQGDSRRDSTDSGITNKYSVSDLSSISKATFKSISHHFENFTSSELSPIFKTADDKSNRTPTNLSDHFSNTNNNQGNKINKDQFFIEIDSIIPNTMSTPSVDERQCDDINQAPTTLKSDHVIKRMSSFNIAMGQFSKKLIDSANTSFRDSNSKFKVSFDVAKNSPDDNNNNYSLNQVPDSFVCKQCQKKACLLDTNDSFNISSSLPNLLDLPDSFIVNKLLLKSQQKEMSTQTSNSNLNIDDEVLQSRSQIINENFSIRKSDNQSLLKHQLTKDSGIDGDHTNNNQNQHPSQLQNSLKISPYKKKNKQINLSNKVGVTESSEELPDSEEMIAKKDTMEPFLNSTVTISKTRPSKLHKSMNIKSHSFSLGSTRDNSVDQEEKIEKMSSDGNDLFGTNVIEEDEFVDNEYIDDSYIGELSKRDGDGKSMDEVDSADEVVEEFKDMLMEENSDMLQFNKDNRKALRDLSNKKIQDEHLNSTMDEFQLNESFGRHRLKLESSQPPISTTSLSKLAKAIRERQGKTEYDIEKIANLSIDEVLNLIETKPAQSTVFSTAVASFWNNKKLSTTDEPNNDKPEAKSFKSIIQKKVPLMSRNSRSFSLAFDDISMRPKTNNSDASKQKMLESNFNQVAMAYHTDVKVLEECISIYREKYRKSNNHLDLVFEEINGSLVKFATFLNDETNSSAQENGKNGKQMSKHSRKILQENVLAINKEMRQMKKMVAELITISSMISGLKQEIHLTDLVKISISYVRELRSSTKNQLNETMKPASPRRVSMTPFDRSITTTGAMGSNASQQRKRWLRTISTISRESIDSNESIEAASTEDLNKLRRKGSIFDFGRSESVTGHNHQSPLNLNESDLKIDAADKSKINQLEESLSEEPSKLMESFSEETVEKRAISSKDHRKASVDCMIAKGSVVYFEQLKQRTQGITDILFESSSTFMRKFMSIGLLLFAFMFILSTLGSELGERCLDFIFKKIEVTNYFDSPRHT